MNAVGIDVSKGKSTVAIMRPFGEVVAEPFEVSHTDCGVAETGLLFGEAARRNKDRHGVHRELLGNLSPRCCTMQAFFVSIVNALLIYKYGNNSILEG